MKMPARKHGENRNRAYTVPIREWWTVACRREIKDGKTTQKAMAKKFEVKESYVSRTINRKVPSLELIEKISSELGIAYPFRIPETEAIAIELAKAHRHARLDADVAELEPGMIIDDGVEHSDGDDEKPVRTRRKKSAPRQGGRRVRPG